MDPILKDVAKSEDKFVSDMQLWREYEAKEKAIRDEISYAYDAKMEGKREDAYNLLKLGVDPQIIVKATGFPLEEVQALAKENK